MSKINLNTNKRSPIEFIKSMFSTPKRIIISVSVIVAIIALCIAIPIIIITATKEKTPTPEPKITLTVNFYDSEGEVLTGVTLYNNSKNTQIYYDAAGSFSINNYDNDIKKGDIIRFERSGYELYLDKENTGDLYVFDSKVILKFNGDTTITIYGKRQLTESELLAKKSVIYSFVDSNNLPIKSQIKAMEKSTIPYDSESGEYDFDDAGIRVLGTSDTSTGTMMITIDDNQINELVIYFYSLNYEFEEVSITKENQDTKVVMTGKLKQFVKDNSYLSLYITLLLPSGAQLTSGKVQYSYVNIYNGRNEYVTKTKNITNGSADILFNDESTMFESMYIRADVNGKNYYAIVFSSLSDERLDVKLKEGYMFQAMYIPRLRVNVIDNDTGAVTEIQCDNNGIFTYISDSFDFTIKKENGEKLYFVILDNDTNSKVISDVVFNNSDIIYSAINNVHLSTYNKSMWDAKYGSN